MKNLVGKEKVLSLVGKNHEGRVLVNDSGWRYCRCLNKPTQSDSAPSKSVKRETIYCWVSISSNSSESINSGVFSTCELLVSVELHPISHARSISNITLEKNFTIF